MTVLTGPDDAPAYELINRDGRGRFVFPCDHASRAVPRALGGLGLDDGELARHIGWDIGAAALARALSARFDSPAVLAGYSRLVIDCNRPPGHSESILAVSDGTDIPGNRDVGPEAAAARAEACFWPYQRAVGAVVEKCMARGEAPILLSVHSCAPAFNGVRRPWHIGVMWNSDERLSAPLIGALRRRPGLVVGENEPYSGAEPNAYTIPVHGERHGLPHVQIEVRHDLVVAPRGVAEWAAVIGDAIDEIIDDPALVRLETPSD